MVSLQDLLVDLISLSAQGKQLHWHVRGRHFKPVHEHLDEVVVSAREYADEIAERSVALDVPVDGRLETVVKESSLAELPGGWISDEEAVRVYVDALSRTVERGRALVNALADDPVTQDVVVQVMEGLEKHLWMFRAQVVR